MSFRAKNIIRSKDCHFIMIKELIHLKLRYLILNIDATNNRSTKYMQ